MVLTCEAVEFVWLDVACIDQTRGSAEMAAEIGRQAKIFAGAKRAFVWCTRHDADSLRQYLEELDSRVNDGIERMKSTGEDPGLEHIPTPEMIDFFASDPWFTSLWTLQEAFLRPDAQLLTRDGQLWPTIPEDGKPEPLFEHAAYYETVHKKIMLGHHKWDEQQCIKVAEAIERTGLLGLVSQCPMGLLAAARHRTTGARNTTDRVYGIMQVFNLQLGKARPGADPTYDFTLEELEDELGEALMQSEPAMSQFYVHTSQPPWGKGWRFGRQSRFANRLDSNPLPASVLDDRPAPDRDTRPPGHNSVALTALSTELVDNVLCGKFGGPVCKISMLHSIWSILGSQALERFPMLFPVWIDRDYSEETRLAHPENIETHLNRVSTVVENYPNAVVLLLERCTQLSKKGVRTPCLAIGLILAPYALHGHPGLSTWRRLGVCAWSFDIDRFKIEMDDQARSLLKGEGERWNVQSGVFG